MEYRSKKLGYVERKLIKKKKINFIELAREK